MSDADPILTPEDEGDLLAAELALGLLEGDEATAAVARLAQDADFAQRVRAWQERLAGMADELVPVMPPVRARQHIREALGHIAPPLSQVPDARIRWWQRPLGLLGALVAVVALALVATLPLLRGPGTPSWQAEIVSQDAAMRVLARLDGRRMEIGLQTGQPGAGRDLEIWWVKPDGSAPVSLGVLPRQGLRELDLPAGLDMAQGVQIALSDEPLGGSPTGQATGPIVAIAPLTSL